MKNTTLQHPGVEWELAQSLLAEQADAYVMHADDPGPRAGQHQESVERTAEAPTEVVPEPMWVLPW